MFEPIRLSANNPGPMTGSGNNTYLLIGGDGAATLIDAGVGDPHHLAAITGRLAERSATLARVLVTHGHADHASGAAALAGSHPSAEFRKYPWPEEDRKFPVAWRGVTDADPFTVGDFTLTAIHTPGHSPDHLVFWEESTRTVFSGDLVALGGSVMIHASRGGDLAQYLAALERVLALQPARLLPAHGPAITEPDLVLRGYIAHRLDRERQVLDALAAGRDSVSSIADYIYDGLDPALMPAAHENVHAHLEKLRREARAFESNARWRL